MAATLKDTSATYSAAELQQRIGDDATATFENDPTFVEHDPTGSASSDNVKVQRSTDDSDDSDDELDDAVAENEEFDEDDDEDDIEDDAAPTQT
jgi:hypothetical protein